MFAQRQTTSSSSRCSALPQAGHVVGITQARLSARRARLRIGLTTFGMTSPPFSIRTVSPSRMSLRATSSALCSVAIEMVDAGEQHRLQDRVRRHRAGAADVHLDVRSIVCRLLRRELEGERPARELRGGAEPLAQRESSTLMTTPSVSNSSVWRLSCPLAAEREHRVDAGAPRASAARPAAASARSALERVRSARARSALARPRRADRRTRSARAARPAPGRGCASCRRRRCAGWRTAARPAPRARG